MKGIGFAISVENAGSLNIFIVLKFKGLERLE